MQSGCISTSVFFVQQAAAMAPAACSCCALLQQAFVAAAVLCVSSVFKDRMVRPRHFPHRAVVTGHAAPCMQETSLRGNSGPMHAM